MTEDLDEGLGIILDKINELGIQDNTYEYICLIMVQSLIFLELKNILKAIITL